MTKISKNKSTPLFTMKDVRRIKKLLIPKTAKELQQEKDLPIPNTMKFIHEILPQGSWKGQRCFIVGGGPSLRGMDLSFLKGELVIGVNRAFEICDPTIIFAMDERLAGWVESKQLGEDCYDKYTHFDGIKCWAFLSILPLLPPEDYYFVKNVNGKYLSDDLASGVRHGTHSGYGALNLAVLLGASPIYLLGYDMVSAPGKKKTWWHEGYPNDGQSAAVYDLFKGEFRSAEESYRKVKENGITIVNLNPKSGLDIFRKSTVAKEKIRAERRPIVICFYTAQYKELAMRMKLSVRRFGFETDVVEIESKGDWLANVHYKTVFMRDKLLEHKRDIVWLDADSVVNRYPAAFVNFDGDLGVHFIDWSRHTQGKRSQIELDDAVTYLAYNERTLAMVEDWIKFNAVCPRRAEQLNLQIMLEQGDYAKKGLRVVNLPAEYCTIFDTMQDVENPVIEQFQASRKFKGVLR